MEKKDQEEQLDWQQEAMYVYAFLLDIEKEERGCSDRMSSMQEGTHRFFFSWIPCSKDQLDKAC